MFTKNIRKSRLYKTVEGKIFRIINLNYQEQRALVADILDRKVYYKDYITFNDELEEISQDEMLKMITISLPELNKEQINISKKRYSLINPLLFIEDTEDIFEEITKLCDKYKKKEITNALLKIYTYYCCFGDIKFLLYELFEDRPVVDFDIPNIYKEEIPKEFGLAVIQEEIAENTRTIIISDSFTKYITGFSITDLQINLQDAVFDALNSLRGTIPCKLVYLSKEFKTCLKPLKTIGCQIYDCSTTNKSIFLKEVSNIKDNSQIPAFNNIDASYGLNRYCLQKELTKALKDSYFKLIN